MVYRGIRNIILVMVLTLVAVQSEAAGRGGAGNAFYEAEPGRIEYTAKIGDISSGGLSIIGVARNSAKTSALIITGKSDSALSVVSTKWLGINDSKLSYADNVKGADSLILYSYSMGIVEGDTAKLNSQISIGKKYTNRFCSAFDIKSSEEELFTAYNLYDRLLSPTERRKVESYFAICHGITFDQTKPTDYIDSKGNVIWNSNENMECKNAIAGIGRDKGSELLHLTGYSIQAPYSPIVSAQDTLSDGMYLMWSHNGEIIKRRIWSITSTGDWNDTPVTVSFRIGGKENLPKLDEGEIYWLKVDSSSNADFADAYTRCYKGIYVDAVTLKFADVKIESPLSHMMVEARSVTEEDIENPFQSITIYPSPSLDGLINVSLSMWQPSDINLRIYNSVGQIIAEKYMSGSAYYDYQGFLPVSGVYVVIAETDGKFSTFKVERR